MRREILTEADHRRSKILLSKLRGEILFLERRGYSKREIDDHLFDTFLQLESGLVSEGLFSALGSGLAWLSNNKFLQPIQKMIAEKIANFIGLEDGFLRDAFINIVENLDYETIRLLLSGEEGKCHKVTTKIVGSLQETFVEYMLKQMGLKPTTLLGDLSQEVLITMFAEEGPLVDGIASSICSISLTDIISGKTKVPGMPEVPEESDMSESVRFPSKSLRRRASTPKRTSRR